MFPSAEYWVKLSDLCYAALHTFIYSFICLIHNPTIGACVSLLSSVIIHYTQTCDVYMMSPKPPQHASISVPKSALGT